MNFTHFIWAIFLFCSLSASGQMALSPSDEEDDDGILTPEYMNFLIDSGRVDANVKVGLWKEYQFASFMSSRRREVRYDSMQYYDSTRRYLRFYRDEGNYVNGIRDGEWKTYVCFKKRLPLKWTHESTVHYSSGKRQGWQMIFSKTGDFVGKKFFKDDLEDSIALYYHRENVPSTVIHYKKGKVHGKSFLYDDHGRILYEMTFDRGQRVGFVFYSKDGSAPHIDGRHDSYYENGKLKSISYYTKGELNGIHKTFYLNGSIEKEMNFNNGGLDGTFKEYFDNQQLKCERIYKSGKPWEVVKTFSKKGKMLSPGTLKDGNGTVLTYNDNGKLITTVHYKNGIQVREDVDD